MVFKCVKFGLFGGCLCLLLVFLKNLNLFGDHLDILFLSRTHVVVVGVFCSVYF